MSFQASGTLHMIGKLKRADYIDRFTRLIRTPGVAGSSGVAYPTFPEGKSFPCRFVPKPSPDILPGADVQMTDAELFFDLSTDLLPDDRVRITHIAGRRVEASDYRIVAGPVRDSLGKTATLALVRE